MLHANWTKYRLFFKLPAGTSRGTLRYKDSWFIHLNDSNITPYAAVGECGLLRGLSYDDNNGYESMLNEVCNAINKGIQTPDITEFPSIRFGLEMAKIEGLKLIPIEGTDEQIIQFYLKEGGKVKLSVLDQNGTKVFNLLNHEFKNGGVYKKRIRTKKFDPGVFNVELKVDEAVELERLVVL